MDDIVKQAMKKWPNVPDCRGWLGLDARGQWYMRDARTQAIGPFASGLPGAKGSLLQHEGLRAFIQRNYAADAQGRWYFQNGPQRVFVELEWAPWVWRLDASGQLWAHDGQPAQAHSVWLDEQGRLFVRTNLGFGNLHSQDMALAAEAVEAGRWQPQPVHSAELPAREGYVLSPQAEQAA